MKSITVIEPTIIIDGPVKIVDYAGIAGNSITLSEFKHKMKGFVPYEIKCIKDKTIDLYHSYVRVVGVKFESQGGTTKQILVEIIYSSIGNFLICVSNFENNYADGKLGGFLELSYEFNQGTLFSTDFKDFFE